MGTSDTVENRSYKVLILINVHSSGEDKGFQRVINAAKKVEQGNK